MPERRTGIASRLAARNDELSPFRVVETMERAWAAERAGRHVFHLEAGEPDFGSPPQVVEAATRAIASGAVPYTSSLGVPELREAISQYYESRYGVVVPASRIVVTTGASAALLLAFGATMDGGDRMLMSDPGYPCNRNILRVCEAATDLVPVTPEQRYQLSASVVDAQWSDSTKSVLIGTPSNPTGTVIDEAELKSVLEVVDERGGVTFVDEVYSELVYGRAPTTALSLSDDVFVINSFSKQFGMTGWRLGWLVCPEWATEAVKVLSQNLYIAPPTPSQAAGLAAFSDEVWAIVEERRVEFEARRDLLVAGLKDIGFGVAIVPEGGFYVYANCSAFGVPSSRFVNEVLDRSDVAISPGADFGNYLAEEHVRFSYTTSRSEIEGGLERLASYLSA